MEREVARLGAAWDASGNARAAQATGKAPRIPTLFERYRAEAGEESFGAWLARQGER
jgi:hypothetical protein